MTKHLILAIAICFVLPACKSDPPAEDRPYRDERPERDAAPEAGLEAPVSPESGKQGAIPAGNGGNQVPKGPWPFVGKRVFETRQAVSGTGTPHRYVEIMPDGGVYFGYGQQNPKAGTMDGERVFAGRFARVMKCEFKALGDTRYYIVGKTSIFELDENGNRLTSEDCCDNENLDMETECPCQGKLFDPGATPDPGM